MNRTERINKVDLIYTIITILLLAVGLQFLSGCSTNPATGEPIFSALVSPEREAQIGKEEHKKIVTHFGVVDNDKLNRYVNEITGRITPFSERRDVTYTLTILDSPVINAFALPGGYLYLTRGLLALAENEAQVAAVIAHEMGHVTARHSAQQISHGTLSGIGATVIGILTESQTAGKVARLGSELYIKNHSRDHEYEADTLGIRYLKQAGYPADAMAGFLRQLDRENKEAFGDSDQPVLATQVQPPEYLSTHPSTDKRVSRADQLAMQAEASGPNIDLYSEDPYGRTSHLVAIDGMVFGPSPNQGFVLDSIFVHPPLGFKFELPDGFKMENTPEKVRASGPNNTRVVFDIDRADRLYAPAIYLGQIWGKSLNFADLHTFVYEGQPAATAVTTLKNNRTIRLTVIRNKNLFYRFAYTGPFDITAFDTFDNGYKFALLDQESAAQYKPSRIDIRALKSKNFSWKKLADQMPAPYHGNITLLKRLNGAPTNSTQPQDKTIKTIVR